MNQLAQDEVPFIFFTDFLGRHGYVRALSQLPNNVLFDFEGASNHEGKSRNISESFTGAPPPYTAYAETFTKVLKEIQLGNSYLVNLTFQSAIKDHVDLYDLFTYSKAKYKLLYQNQFICFSPETFVKISREGIISSYPMKGTIDASTPNALETILADEKEIAEHTTIVDLIRNDLSKIASDISVPRFRYVDEIQTSNKNLLQVSSEIQGHLTNDWKQSIGDIIFNLLPAGSICGAPKAKTIEIILENENYDRGFYSGVCGLFDGQKLNSGVMIRFIDRQENNLFYKSGGGITAFSDPEKEYHELLDKIYVPVH